MLSKDITLVRTAIGICLYTGISCCFLAAVAALVQRWRNLTGRFVWFRENLHVLSLRFFLPVFLQRPRNGKEVTARLRKCSRDSIPAFHPKP